MKGGPADTAIWAACASLLTDAGVKALRLDWTATRGTTWLASAWDETGNRINANGLGPSMALASLTERIAANRKCECGRPIALSDKTMYANGSACRWRLEGARFVPGHTRSL